MLYVARTDTKISVVDNFNNVVFNCYLGDLMFFVLADLSDFNVLKTLAEADII